MTSEEILFDAEPGIVSFEVPRAVVLDAMAQGQVLRTSRCADRIGLDKAHPVQGALQRGGREETARDCKPPQAVQRDRHDWDIGGEGVARSISICAGYGDRLIDWEELCLNRSATA